VTQKPGTDWSLETYARFRGFRLRPALDLLAQVPPILPDGPVVDLGCGAGAVGAALARRFPDRPRIGVDLSTAMLHEADRTGCYDDLVTADIGLWRPDAAPALIYSNAALNWVAGHETLLPALAAALTPGGVLAVQVPDQQAAPSHRLLRRLSAEMFPELFDWRDWAPEVLSPDRLADLLAPLGRLDLWQTTYHQRLFGEPTGHPVRHFTESTAARPVLLRLDAPRRDRFLNAYDAELAAYYPVAEDGSVQFAFQRLFFILERGG
jgi:trans-aconitate 2-methyltransferase